MVGVVLGLVVVGVAVGVELGVAVVAPVGVVAVAVVGMVEAMMTMKIATMRMEAGAGIAVLRVARREGLVWALAKC